MKIIERVKEFVRDWSDIIKTSIDIHFLNRKYKRLLQKALRDEAYIAQRKLENDASWKGYEKWLYFNRKNQEYIIPTIIGCFGLLFLNGCGIVAAVGIIFIVKQQCNKNNMKLELDINIQKARIKEIELSNRYKKMKEKEQERKDKVEEEYMNSFIECLKEDMF